MITVDAPSKCFLCGKSTTNPSIVSCRWVCFDCIDRIDGKEGSARQWLVHTKEAVAATEREKHTGYTR